MKNQWIARFTIGIVVAISIFVGVAWFQPDRSESDTNNQEQTETSEVKSSPVESSPDDSSQVDSSPVASPSSSPVDPSPVASPSPSPVDPSPVASPSPSPASVVLNGNYMGNATLNGVYSGVHSDEDVTPEEQELGYIDLALNLSREGNKVTGFVILDETLLYSKEHTITVTPVGPPVDTGTPTPEPEALDIGPMVSGTFNGTTMSLTSEKFTMMLSPEDGENLLERQITRQFVLKTTQVENNGVTLIGEYRETIWGYSPYPSTVVGIFQLQRPDFSSSN